MKDAIECAFSGRVGSEPVLKQSKSGKPWASFTVAVGGEGEDKEDTRWIRVAVFGTKAEELAGDGSLTKGAHVYIEGRLKLDRWTAKDGTQQSGLSVAASLVQPMGQIGARRPAKRKAAASIDVYAPLNGSARPHSEVLNDPVPF
jgi:single-strand DNA-binding protein